MNDPAAAATPSRAYPLPAPADDSRFTHGLFNDITEILQQHGFPRLTSSDRVNLMIALHQFIYASQETS
ncbi:hypothetical protein [Dactylosporangium matsuzakiense]|uniref:Uncharacterized protein n=1 Tax=Dactylosporangium matsuzakiense TaxID=53360 RepID=A0A9W6KWW3_9ACTN|nr:hypothetical protein [Dactylosporangium matsuzakiense]GLL08808.1 hypothetical protein GCM10017581_105850 [Dactylosporangium matsuzakiense]